MFLPFYFSVPTCFHGTRHTFATNALSSGIRPDLASEVLSQPDLKTTRIYACYPDEILMKEMRKFRL